ncbi:glycoside hydrolase family 76 protein [Arthrobacter sp. STN4]|uniref:glycoside hydrolase family 76 protein n=1 Tax=Arthrobacter sp. STN4 TaxID=2923276 RepID=UPI00211A613C|nr:glycoside hydrolase family 76 protein [Arthrobacter sp. STN4]MCQ9162862.1 glycosyl hydrolase [Arthrobacter sp. STN4]
MTRNSTGHGAGQAGGQPDTDWAGPAAAAARAVHARFGHRLMGLPGTWIGAVAWPAPVQAPWSEWHYWWQAHYLDAVVDSGWRSLRHGNRAAATRDVARGKALLRGILLRNFGRFPNYYYDDMAWLALAADRLGGLARAAGSTQAALAGFASATLAGQLRSAYDTVLGGGIYWSRKRDYKNTPANGPAALHFARSGEPDHARALADWLRVELFDAGTGLKAGTGLYLDGVHPTASGPEVERTIYTYNQGPILAALLELDHPQYAGQAAELVAAVERRLATADGGLRLEPGADGSLFTGILCRYLALAAQEPRLPGESRAAAARLVTGTARALAAVPEPAILSAAVQRWTVLEAAATLPQLPTGSQ